MNLKTPGREDDDQEVKLYTKADVNAKRENASKNGEAVQDELSELITRGLGGKKNIDGVDCCATRLRCTVIKPDLVDDALLRSTGASGVIHKGSGIQIVYGPHVTVIKSNLEDYLETAPDVEYTERITLTAWKRQKKYRKSIDRRKSYKDDHGIQPDHRNSSRSGNRTG